MSSLIKPAAPFEPQERDEGTQPDDGKRNGVAPRPIELRHELEIHPVNPDHYRRRYADNRYDREHLEQIVLLDADESENGIQQELDLVGKLSLVVVERGYVFADGREPGLELRNDPIVTDAQHERRDAGHSQQDIACQRQSIAS